MIIILFITLFLLTLGVTATGAAGADKLSRRRRARRPNFGEKLFSSGQLECEAIQFVSCVSAPARPPEARRESWRSNLL